MPEPQPLPRGAAATQADLMRLVRVMLEVRAVPYSEVNVADDGVMEVSFSRTFPVKNRVRVQGTIHEIAILARDLNLMGLRCRFA